MKCRFVHRAISAGVETLVRSPSSTMASRVLAGWQVPCLDRGSGTLLRHSAKRASVAGADGEAPKIAEFMKTSSEVATKFVKAPGNVEVTMDATKVNTMGGWRDVKLGIFSKRLLGESALPKDYGTRKLPGHTARVAFAAIEKKDRFRNRLKEWRRRLRPGLTGDISALADGAACPLLF